VCIGSEGMLGVVTEVTVKLIPKPQLARVIMASFDDVVKGGDAVASVIAAASSGRFGDDGQTSSRMVEPFVQAAMTSMRQRFCYANRMAFRKKSKKRSSA